RFQAQYFYNGAPPTLTADNRGEIVSALLMSERNLVSANIPSSELQPFFDLKESVLGSPVNTASKPSRDYSQRSITEGAKDAVNRSTRRMGVTDLAMEHLQNTIIDMNVDRKRALERAKASEGLVDALSEKLRALPTELSAVMAEEFKTQHE